MKLNYLQAHNFRQFYGTTPKIVFASGPENITVIHGCNGSGKTAILNAFTWVLYGSFTRGFQFPDQLVNKRAVREANLDEEVKGWVELGFEHNEVNYRIRREATARRTSDGQDYKQIGTAKPKLELESGDGRWEINDNFADVVNRILPEDLHTYFFFDGERIERIVQPGKEERRDISRATKKLLGIEILERAVKHLKSANKALEEEWKYLGDVDTQKLIDAKSSIELRVDELKKEEEDIHANIDKLTECKEAVEKKLRVFKEAKDLQEKREGLETKKETAQSRLKESYNKLASLISSDAYSILFEDGVNDFRALIDNLYAKGDLPSGIKQKFVKELLDGHICICGAQLDEGTEPRRRVEEWMSRAGLDSVEDKASRMGGEIKEIESKIERFWPNLDDHNQTIQKTRREISDYEDQLDEIRKILKGSPKEEISKLQSRLDDIEKQISDGKENKGRIEGLIEEREKEKADIEQQISKLKVRESKQILAKRRVDAAKDSINRIDRVRALIETEFRQSLRERISKLFRSISYTPYIPSLEDDYSLRLLESAGGSPLPVAASQGESQILSLSFIGSIIELAREYQEKTEHLPGPDSSKFPIVMDSPFGTLDPIYRYQIASHIPKLADQVVVMVTKTQWKGNVEEAMKDKIGKTYVMTYYTPKDDVNDERILVKDKSYELIKQSPNEYEYTEIFEVDRG